MDRRELLRALMTGRLGAAGAGTGVGADAAGAPGEGARPKVLAAEAATRDGEPGGVAPWRRLSDVLEVAALLGLESRETEMEVGARAAEDQLLHLRALGDVGGMLMCSKAACCVCWR
jgi:hypothetical protein